MGARSGSWFKDLFQHRVVRAGARKNSVKMCVLRVTTTTQVLSRALLDACIHDQGKEKLRVCCSSKQITSKRKEEKREGTSFSLYSSSSSSRCRSHLFSCCLFTKTTFSGIFLGYKSSCTKLSGITVTHTHRESCLPRPNIILISVPLEQPAWTKPVFSSSLIGQKLLLIELLPDCIQELD